MHNILWVGQNKNNFIFGVERSNSGVQRLMQKLFFCLSEMLTFVDKLTNFENQFCKDSIILKLEHKRKTSEENPTLEEFIKFGFSTI
tara:strand:+ start:294 stop:554 length:261 start_codon:yes stop_codon:yes gene_type:complete